MIDAAVPTLRKNVKIEVRVDGPSSSQWHSAKLVFVSPNHLDIALFKIQSSTGTFILSTTLSVVILIAFKCIR